MQAVQQVPGAASATTAPKTPLSTNSARDYRPDGRQAPRAGPPPLRYPAQRGRRLRPETGHWPAATSKSMRHCRETGRPTRRSRGSAKSSLLPFGGASSSRSVRASSSNGGRSPRGLQIHAGRLPATIVLQPLKCTVLGHRPPVVLRRRRRSLPQRADDEKHAE